MEAWRVKIKYILITTAAVLLLYNSVYFEHLEKVKERAKRREFDPVEYARDFWDNRLPVKLPEAVEADVLLGLFHSDMKRAVRRYSRTLGVSSTHAYLIKGFGRVLSVEEEAVILELLNSSGYRVKITTDLIFGNAIRDASGLVNVNDFSNTMIFNTISGEINKIVNREVIPPFRKAVRKGKIVKFYAASEVNEASEDLNPLETVPVELQVK